MQHSLTVVQNRIESNERNKLNNRVLSPHPCDGCLSLDRKWTYVCRGSYMRGRIRILCIEKFYISCHHNQEILCFLSCSNFTRKVQTLFGQFLWKFLRCLPQASWPGTSIHMTNFGGSDSRRATKKLFRHRSRRNEISEQLHG